jgi:small-conductance mechanosensitive channel
MQQKHPTSPIKRTLPALVAALSMTGFIGLAVLAFGLNALFNKNISTAQAATQPELTTAADQAVNQDLQSLVSQYQEREVQYQDQLLQATNQINEISQQNQQYRQLIQALQNAGVIQITNDGQVLLSRPAPRFGDDND